MPGLFAGLGMSVTQPPASEEPKPIPSQPSNQMPGLFAGLGMTTQSSNEAPRKESSDNQGKKEGTDTNQTDLFGQLSMLTPSTTSAPKQQNPISFSNPYDNSESTPKHNQDNNVFNLMQNMG